MSHFKPLCSSAHFRYGTGNRNSQGTFKDGQQASRPSRPQKTILPDGPPQPNPLATLHARAARAVH